MDEEEKLLGKNGWTIECQSPFEIRHNDGSFATMQAAHSVVSELEEEEEDLFGSIKIIVRAYENDLINKKVFVKRICALFN